MELLEELARAHRDDKDAGESLVEEVRLRLHRLPEHERRRLEAELVETVRDGPGDLAGVALEVFVREGTQSVDLLYDIFREARNENWQDQLALALMRLGPLHLAEPLAAHVALVLNGPNQTSGATELGYLHRINPNAFYELAVPYLAKELKHRDSRRVIGLLPVYVSQLSENGGAPLMELLEQLCRRDAIAASLLARNIVEFLSKSWAGDHVDFKTSSALRDRLSDWRCGEA